MNDDAPRIRVAIGDTAAKLLELPTRTIVRVDGGAKRAGRVHAFEGSRSALQVLRFETRMVLPKIGHRDRQVLIRALKALDLALLEDYP